MNTNQLDYEDLVVAASVLHQQIERWWPDRHLVVSLSRRHLRQMISSLRHIRSLAVLSLDTPKTTEASHDNHEGCFCFDCRDAYARRHEEVWS